MLRRQAAEAAALAEQRARERAMSDREWGRKLGGRDKELAGRVKDLKQKLQAADERGELNLGERAGVEAEKVSICRGR